MKRLLLLFAIVCLALSTTTEVIGQNVNDIANSIMKSQRSTTVNKTKKKTTATKQHSNTTSPKVQKTQKTQKTQKSQKATTRSQVKQQEDYNTVYDAAIVEKMPEFPGGDSEIMKFIANNLQYPASAIENEIQGKVIVQFTVTKTGEVSDVSVMRSVDPDIDQEAVRVISKLPKFKPGTQNGKAVNVRYTYPVTFRLQN